MHFIFTCHVAIPLTTNSLTSFRDFIYPPKLIYFIVIFILIILFSLQLLSNEESEITNKALNTEDLDTPPDELLYNIDSITNGIIALKEYPEDSIKSFTQEQINNREIIFIHQGSSLHNFSGLLNKWHSCWKGKKFNSNWYSNRQ